MLGDRSPAGVLPSCVAGAMQQLGTSDPEIATRRGGNHLRQLVNAYEARRERLLSDIGRYRSR